MGDGGDVAGGGVAGNGGGVAGNGGGVAGNGGRLAAVEHEPAGAHEPRWNTNPGGT